MFVSIKECFLAGFVILYTIFIVYLFQSIKIKLEHVPFLNENY